MRIGVLSDTHDRLPVIKSILDRFVSAGISTVCHAGDIVAPFAARLLADFPGTVHVIYGNNDGERKGLKNVLPQIQDGPLWLELGNRQIMMHHALEWCREDDLARADIVFTGHTHEKGTQRRGETLLVNPGEACGWTTGKPTAAILDLKTDAIEWIEIPTS